MRNKFLGTGDAGYHPLRKIKVVLAGLRFAILYAYSTQTGQPFQRKLDTRSTPNWTVGAQRRAGVMVFTLGGVPPSMWV